MKIFFYIFLSSLAIFAQAWNQCDYCPPGDPVCASDYRTYPSECQLLCYARRYGIYLHVLYYGPCVAASLRSGTDEVQGSAPPTNEAQNRSKATEERTGYIPTGWPSGIACPSCSSHLNLVERSADITHESDAIEERYGHHIPPGWPSGSARRYWSQGSSVNAAVKAADKADQSQSIKERWGHIPPGWPSGTACPSCSSQLDLVARSADITHESDAIEERYGHHLPPGWPSGSARSNWGHAAQPAGLSHGYQVYARSGLGAGRGAGKGAGKGAGLGAGNGQANEERRGHHLPPGWPSGSAR